MSQAGPNLATFPTNSASILEQLLQTTQEGFWHIDNEAMTIDLNPAMCRILGRKREEVIGRSIYDFVDTDNRETFVREIAARQQCAPGSYEISLRRSDGLNVSCINNATPILNDDGEKIGSVGLWTEISNTNTFRNSIENSAKGTVILSEQGTILFANTACAQIFGFDDVNEIVGLPYTEELVADDDRLRLNQFHQSQQQDDDKNNLIEYSALRKDRSAVRLQESFQRIIWHGETALEAKLVDITGRYETEQALREKESLLTAIIDNSTSGIFLKDLDGTYQIVNRSFAEWLGRPTSDLVGRTAEAFFPADSATRRTEEDLSIIENGDVLEGEFEFPVGTDDRRVIRYSKFPVSQPDGKVTRIGVVGVDITKQKDIESALLASKERFQDFAESSADWFWEMDRDLRFTWMSSNVERIVGVPPEWHFGKTREELLGPDYDREQWAEHLETLKSHKPFRNFTFYRVGDGIEPKWLTSSGKPFYSADGEFLGYRGTGSDVSALKQREIALSESERSRREALEKSPIGVAIFIQTRRCGQVKIERLFANEALADMMGAESRDAMMTMDTSDSWVYPNQRETVERAIENGRQLVDFQALRRRKDGTEWWVSLHTRPIRYDRQDCTMVWHIDITERKKTEESLRETTALLRAMVDQMPALISLKNLDGEYLLANPAFAAFHGMTLDELIGSTAFDLGLERSHAEAITAQDRKVAATGTVQIEERGVCDPVDAYERAVTKFPTFDADGSVNGIGTISVDVGTRKSMEAQLRQAQKMEAVGQLTGGIAHDFNNLLGVVIGNLDFLDETIDGDDDQRELINVALKAALQGAELTSRLLAFSRRQSLSPEIVDLGALVRGVLDLLKRTLGETITIQTTVQPALNLVEVDTVQLETALVNLTVNARQAMPDGGRLTIEASNIELDESDAAQHDGLNPGSYVMLTVTDTGMGMTENTVERAFEPFFTTKEVGQGSGLGLSMVFGFVKQSNGYVSINSDVGKGTSVSLYFPVTAREPSPLPKKTIQEPIPMGSGETVLVVEDDASLRELATKSVSSLGYNVIEAEDGPSALAILDSSNNVDILFTDVVLPKGMNGVALSQEALKRRPKLRVLYTSGYTENAIANSGVAYEDIDLVDKPYRRADLARRLQNALNTN